MEAIIDIDIGGLFFLGFVTAAINAIHFYLPTVQKWTILTLFSVYFSVIVIAYIVYHLCSKHDTNRHLRDVKGKHICITGGSSGLGASLAKESVLRRAKWVTLISRTQNDLDNVREMLTELANKIDAHIVIQTISADVTDPVVIQDAITKAAHGMGKVTKIKKRDERDADLQLPTPIDFLICNAGLAIPKIFDELNTNEINKMIAVNLIGTINSIKAVLPSMKQNRKGSIVIVNSEGGLCAVYGYSVYSATKYGLTALALSLDHELRFHNIFVASAFPPTMNTRGYKEESLKKPHITNEIEGTTQLMEPDEAAKRMLDSVIKGRQRITFGPIGFLLSTLCSGTAPVNNFLSFCCEAFFMGFTRIIAIFITSGWYSIIQKNMKLNR